MLLMAAFNVLMSRLSGQEDIVVGSPAAGRNHADLQQIIGMFVNTLALRNYPSGRLDFKTFLQLFFKPCTIREARERICSRSLF